jgi:hypothetical protein
MLTFSCLSAAVAAFDTEGGYLLSRWVYATSTYEVYDVLSHEEALAFGYEAEWLASLGPAFTNVPPDAIARARA